MKEYYSYKFQVRLNEGNLKHYLDILTFLQVCCIYITIFSLLNSYTLLTSFHVGMHIRLCGRLFQQYMVDVFSCIEQSRLWWLRTHQSNLRNDLYTNIAKNISKGNLDPSTTGKGFIL